MPRLEVQQLSQRLGGRIIVENVSFNAYAGTITAFLGPNGAGKTTLLKTVMGLHGALRDTQITLDGDVITAIPVHARVERGLVYVPQYSSLFGQMTVRDNLSLVYQNHPGWAGVPRSKFDERATDLLQKTHLESTPDQLAMHLSGGQQRKLEVVRALLMHPRVVLFDEPFAGVDPKSIYELKELFCEMAKNDIAVVISDHHVDQLLSIASYVYVVIGGHVVTEGTIEEIMKDKALKERYLGAQFHQEVANRFL